MKTRWCLAAALLLAFAAFPAGALVLCECDQQCPPGSRCIDYEGQFHDCSDWVPRHCILAAPATDASEQTLDQFLDSLTLDEEPTVSQPAAPVVTPR